MVLDLDQVPSQLLKPVPIVEGNAATQPMGAGLPGVNFEIRRISSPGGLADVIAVEEAVWNEKMEWIHDHLGSYLHDYPELLSVYVAYVDGVPASAAWVFFFSNSPVRQPVGRLHAERSTWERSVHRLVSGAGAGSYPAQASLPGK